MRIKLSFARETWPRKVAHTVSDNDNIKHQMFSRNKKKFKHFLSTVIKHWKLWIWKTFIKPAMYCPCWGHRTKAKRRKRCVCACVCVCMWLYVCVRACERERERENEADKTVSESKRSNNKKQAGMKSILSHSFHEKSNRTEGHIFQSKATPHHYPHLPHRYFSLWLLFPVKMKRKKLKSNVM